MNEHEEKTYRELIINKLDRLDDKIVAGDKVSSDILVQVKKTNGRVNQLEGWRQFATGSVGVIIIVIVPLFSWMLYKVATIDTTVQNAVSVALIPYTK